MIITEKGKYKLLEDITTRGSRSIGGIAKGVVIEITQIDANSHKVIGPQLMDWTYWELPVEKIPGGEG